MSSPKNKLAWISKTAFIHFMIASPPRGCEVLEKSGVSSFFEYTKLEECWTDL